jgi:hypothetical protein
VHARDGVGFWRRRFQIHFTVRVNANAVIVILRTGVIEATWDWGFVLESLDRCALSTIQLITSIAGRQRRVATGFCQTEKFTL